jgi:aerobic-type carbon monoxide dehydrogenase small subunit (CoxS/CutS family)
MTLSIKGKAQRVDAPDGMPLLWVLWDPVEPDVARVLHSLSECV